MCRDVPNDENINLDIMHGLPDQSIVAAIKDLRTAVEQGPSHISWYQLTIEPNTYFYSYPPKLPKETIQDSILEEGMKILNCSGFSQYEVSAFAKNSKKSSHNHNYWSFGDYLGIGSGAHGKLTLPNENKLIRTIKPKRPDHYMSQSLKTVTQLKEIPAKERTIEFLMNALRLKKGFSRSLFEKRTGNEFSVISNKVSNLVASELIEINFIENENFYSATEKGYRFLNTLLGEFL